ncbi:unnamed protein product [Sphagnum balticum]
MLGHRKGRMNQQYTTSPDANGIYNNQASQVLQSYAPAYVDDASSGAPLGAGRPRRTHHKLVNTCGGLFACYWMCTWPCHGPCCGGL